MEFFSKTHIPCRNFNHCTTDYNHFFFSTGRRTDYTQSSFAFVLADMDATREREVSERLPSQCKFFLLT